jgi:hypothetical protein
MHWDESAREPERNVIKSGGGNVSETQEPGWNGLRRCCPYRSGPQLTNRTTDGGCNYSLDRPGWGYEGREEFSPTSVLTAEVRPRDDKRLSPGRSSAIIWMWYASPMLVEWP